jgi:3-oxoacyl-[acyl-carrier protein] reductase
MAIDLGYSRATAVVTGGTRGIGREVVRLLLNEGARVLAVGSRPETAEKLRAEITDEKLVVIAQDMRAPDSGANVVAAAVSAFGGIDLVVNNAAAFDYTPADLVDRTDFMDLFELKALGYWSLARAATAELAKRMGAIVNVAGVAGVVPNPDSPHVGATNAAVINLTQGMAKALAPRGIRVNVISPGATDTDRFATRTALLAVRTGVAPEAARTELGSGIPIGHPADPAEIALIVAMLGAPVLRSVTGTHIVADGGSTLAGRRDA